MTPDPETGLNAIYISYRRGIEAKAVGKRAVIKNRYEALADKSTPEAKTLWRMFQLWNRIANAAKEPPRIPMDGAAATAAKTKVES